MIKMIDKKILYEQIRLLSEEKIIVARSLFTMELACRFFPDLIIIQAKDVKNLDFDNKLIVNDMKKANLEDIILTLVVLNLVELDRGINHDRQPN